MKQQELTIEKIYKANKSVIYYSILNNIKNVEVVEELTNEVFLKFNKVLSESGFDDSKAKPLTYLYHIKKSVVVDYYRKKKLETNSIDSILVDGVNEPSSQPLNEYDSNNLKSKIESAIDELKPNYKSVAQLYFIDEYKYDEICEELNLPLNTVKNIIFRCRETLQAKLKSIKEEYCKY